jgi:hypothetical protein
MPTVRVPMSRRASRSRSDALHRLVAVGCAALVFALSVFAASPVAHDWLHDDGATPADDACAVVMFAGGVSLPVGPIALTPPTPLVGSVSPVTAADVFLVSPRYLRQPERGPPAYQVG